MTAFWALFLFTRSCKEKIMENLTNSALLSQQTQILSPAKPMLSTSDWSGTSGEIIRISECDPRQSSGSKSPIPDSPKMRTFPHSFVSVSRIFASRLLILHIFPISPPPFPLLSHLLPQIYYLCFPFPTRRCLSAANPEYACRSGAPSSFSFVFIYSSGSSFLPSSFYLLTSSHRSHHRFIQFASSPSLLARPPVTVRPSINMISLLLNSLIFCLANIYQFIAARLSLSQAV